EEDTTCLICLEPVEHRLSYDIMVCPACKHAWFHRTCIQTYAIYTGLQGFCCPHCKNVFRFYLEMLSMGIRIPRRGPLLERRRTYPAVNQRHRRCDASECLCPGGREQAENEG
ncbi:G2E3 ligase, partial [Atlantisia rogersi]|nr:G2E3 ligase [Atlantisia rogersi]